MTDFDQENFDSVNTAFERMSEGIWACKKNHYDMFVLM